jgi:serine/threonine-protein kinase
MGVLHRDIKPENILFSQRHPVVTDFGIARAISTAGAANLTRTGFPLGTPGYMSPEQAAGLTDLDERSDVYGLGAVLYEMLVGEIPRHWPTDDAHRAGRFLEAPPAHRARLAELGDRIEGALVRALATRQDQRTPSPEALIADLAGRSVRPRRYGEGEVREIVRRASEMEASNPTASGALTIGGVEALAAEVGIAPATVRAAAESMGTDAALAQPVPGHRNPWIGGPTSLLFERVVEGELPESEYPYVVEEIRRRLDHPGQVSQLGRSFTWTTSRMGPSVRSLEVSVAVRGGRTRISARENLGPLMGSVFGGIGGGMGGGGMGPIIGIMIGGLGMPPEALLAVVPLWLTGVYWLARRVYRGSVARRQAVLSRLVDRLAELTRELGPERRVDGEPDRLQPP